MSIHNNNFVSHLLNIEDTNIFSKLSIYKKKINYIEPYISHANLSYIPKTRPRFDVLHN